MAQPGSVFPACPRMDRDLPCAALARLPDDQNVRIHYATPLTNGGAPDKRANAIELLSAEVKVEQLKGRITAKGLVVRLDDITDRDAAQALYGAELWVSRSQLPKAKPGEYYWVDLEGLRVVNREAVEFGTVSHLFETPANPVLVVEGERERLIPFLLERFVDSVDFETGVITVDWDADF